MVFLFDRCLPVFDFEYSHSSKYHNSAQLTTVSPYGLLCTFVKFTTDTTAPPLEHIMLKRKRDPTFTTSEKEALLELISTHFFIVESKKTDAVSMKQKTEGWRKIATEFKSISSIYPRNWTVLKNCWENLKKRAKHEQTLRNKHFLGTGGRPPQKGVEDPIINRVLELIQARVSGFVNCFDLDGTKTSDSDFCKSQTLVKVDNSTVTTSSDMITTYTMDRSRYTPSMPREKKSPVFMNSPSPDVQQQQKPPDSQDCHSLSTPPRAQTPNMTELAATTRCRRRPSCKKKTETTNILKEKIKSLLNANVHAEEEHEVKMNILRLQEEKEKELLKQEIIKTKQEDIKLQILEVQLNKLKD